jgi:hypothetical protein
MTKLEVDTEEEAKMICSMYQLRHKNVQFRRFDSIVYIFVNGKFRCRITMLKWMNNLRAQPSINAPGRTSPFLKAQIQYDGRPS